MGYQLNAVACLPPRKSRVQKLPWLVAEERSLLPLPVNKHRFLGHITRSIVAEETGLSWLPECMCVCMYVCVCTRIPFVITSGSCVWSMLPELWPCTACSDTHTVIIPVAPPPSPRVISTPQVRLWWNMSPLHPEAPLGHQYRAARLHMKRYFLSTVPWLHYACSSRNGQLWRYFDRLTMSVISEVLNDDAVSCVWPMSEILA